MGGSELNYAPNFEEEMSDVDSWLDALDLGNNAARVNPEQILFNPDLNKESTKLDADLKGYQRQGYTDQTLRGRKPSAHVSLDRFVADTARRLGLDEGAVGLRYFGFSELTDSAQKPTFEALTAALARAGLAEDLWQHVIDEPFFTIFEGGKTTVVAVGAKWGANGLEAISQEEVRNAVAHELGHVFFRNYLADALKDAKRRNALLSHLGLKSDVTDLQVEEAVAEAVREQVIGGKPAPKSLVGRIFEGIKSALGRLVGRDSVTLESLADHIVHRSNSSDGVAFFSGRRLLEGSARFGEGAWATMKDLYNAVVRTTHSWLRAQRGADGTPLKSFQLLADILRWTPGQSPVTRSLGGQLFDFEIAHGDYHQSYEQATTREFARYGNRVEAMLDSWAPAREKAPFWDAKKRAEIAEEQRQRQVAAVRDFVAGRDTEEARDLRRFFDELGRYFGPVLKRFDETKVLPRIFDQEALRTRKDDFLALLAERGLTEEDADRTYSILTLEQGSDYRNDAGQFFAPHFQRARMGDRLDAISDADLLPFLLIDSQPQAALWQYVHQAVKRTEFERRFGGWTYFDGNADFAPSDTLRPRLVTPADEALLRNAQPIRDDRGRVHYELERPDGKKQQVLWDQTAKYRLLRTLAAEDGASTAQLNYLLKTMEAELGRYGANFSPRIRAAQSALIAGMNWAVLPLSLTSQLTDLALPLLRSNGSFSAAWKGMRATIAEMRQAGDLTLAARANGVLAGNLRSYFASAYLDTPFLSAGAQKWNERLFKYNGMERATEFVRLFAFATGREWIKSLAAKNDAESNVQLQQLGLTRDDVAAWAAGQEKLDTGEGGLSDVDERVQQALNAFVEQSMFRPSASQRPAWASHPAAQLVWYLKSYMWSYADTVLSRTWREFQRMDGYGQKALMLALPALFMMPLAALGLALRDELRDELGSALPWRGPKREQEEAATDYAAKLVGRTGLFGPMQTLLDAGRASEYGSPYYLSLIGPFATMTDQILKRVATSGEGKTAEGVTDALLRITPVIGGLPQERKALVGWAF